MTIRQNLCPNPALGANATGWSGSSSPARDAAITGMLVTTGIETTVVGNIITPTGVVAPSDVITISFQIKNNSGALIAGGKQVFIAYTRSAGGDVFPENFNTAALGAVGNVQRASFTCAAAPALATGIYLVIDNLDIDVQVSALMYEKAASLGAYFDGTFPNCVWDGAAHNSTSTFNDTPAGGSVMGSDITQQLVLACFARDL